MHDLIVKGGTVIDGSGGEPVTADVAVDDGRITEVGKLSARARRVVDADGAIVSPGFVDIHTHYDAQATWDPHLTPSCWHGVTTAVCGNCGVGFAPAAPDRHEWLIELMEGVEDIPGSALSEGIIWNWESFPEYLDALDKTPLAVDLGTQISHGALRGYVMGERGARNEAATADDVERMAALVREAIEAGALGFSSSRTRGHRALDGEPVPGSFAAEDELFGIGRAMQSIGQGVFELSPAGTGGDTAMDGADDILEEMDWMCRLAIEIDRPVSFTMLQYDSRPNRWRECLEMAAETAKKGGLVYPQIAGRPFGMLAGHQTIVNPYKGKPSYDALEHLPVEEKAALLRNPELKKKILEEAVAEGEYNFFADPAIFENIYPLGDPPNYEPSPDESLAAIARARGVPVEELAWETLMGDEGRELLLFPFMNYSDRSCDPHREMILNPQAVLGLGDGGAHCGLICDASLPTFMLSHWARDRSRGETIPLEFIIKRMTTDTAKVYGLNDRGLLAPGYKADINIFDASRVQLRRPEMVFDLPAGARRLIQRSDGYIATLVSGETVMDNGHRTDARPGQLIRGAQAAP